MLQQTESGSRYGSPVLLISQSQKRLAKMYNDTNSLSLLCFHENILDMLVYNGFPVLFKIDY